MQAQDQQLWLQFAERHVPAGPLRRDLPGLLRSWERRLAEQPSYLQRWLATTTTTDPQALLVLLTELAWLPNATARPPLSDPGGARDQVAQDRAQRALALFREPPLSAEELRAFSARFRVLSEEVEALLWRRTSDATFLALAKLLQLVGRTPPAQETPLALAP